MRRLLLMTSVALIGSTSLIACGGDDSSSGSSGVSIEEFCAKIDDLENALEPDDMASAVAALSELVDSSPSSEVRKALETLIPVITKMADIDENDPDAIGELMGLMMDPDVMEAGTVLETFGAEQCGFSES